MTSVTYTTKPCARCGKTSKVGIPRRQFERWQDGEYIQHALPDASPETRELLISGTHPSCWTELFGEDE